jgi:ATP-dependent exoDNAse (exonuclease V) beta subunit
MFKIYNASAGSGKTYSLVKDYLKRLFESKAYLPHKHILAITFTNKAVDEMKQRILQALIRFSDSEIIKSKDPLFIDLVDELQISAKMVSENSKILLQKILHNYGGFEISTIDKFNQRILRTFSYDLKLSSNFEVELDSKFLIKKSVDSLINKAGKEDNLTRTLIDYAISKTDDDKSWDISIDLNKSAQLLLQEDAISYINTFIDKSLTSFSDFKFQLKDEFLIIEKQVIDISNQILGLISKAGLDYSDFNRSSIPKHFEKLILLTHKMTFSSKWHNDIQNYSFYTQKTADKVKQGIDSLKEEIIKAFEITKRGIYKLKYLKNIIDNITPNSVLALINNELTEIKSKKNLVLISEFNSIISNEIKSQPTPFIYERIGEKYNHIFIDEFQDTSTLQWQNLIPLVQNVLANPENSVLLAGDAKQSIYRWRGGYPDQFMDLIYDRDSFPFKADIFDLPTNFRSSKEIVKFNNSFFNYISNRIFSNNHYQKLYNDSKQKANDDQPGFVQLEFLDFESFEQRAFAYADKVLEIINSTISENLNIDYKDICILVRKQKEGVAIANHLINNEIPIISSQSLLISSSNEVMFIIAFFKYIINPNDQISHLFLINYIIDKHKIKQAHSFREESLSCPPKAFFNALNTFGINFEIEDFLNQSLYDATEAIIGNFSLVKSSDAYVQLFLDFVFEFSQKYTSNISSFIEYFEHKKDSLSLSSSEGVNAVRILTIHKAKGLEFPVVIFPFADLNIYKEIEPKEWISSSHLDTNFPYLLMNYNKDFEHFNQETNKTFNEHQSKLELDNINLLYVALTRAAQQLYVIGKNPKESSADDSLKTYSDLLVNFLDFSGKWEPEKFKYCFGLRKENKLKNKSAVNSIKPKAFYSTAKKNLNVSIIQSKTQDRNSFKNEAIKKGNLIHSILAKVYVKSDVEDVINGFLKVGLISKTESEEFSKIVYSIVTHPKLSSYYKIESEVFNEREILTQNEQIIIPDRLVLNNDNEAVIIDYKTGEPNKSHKEQLEHYALVVKSLGFRIDKKILIYIYPELNIKTFK